MATRTRHRGRTPLSTSIPSGATSSRSHTFPYLVIAVDTAKISGWAHRYSASSPITLMAATGAPVSGVVLAHDLTAVGEVVESGILLADRLGVPHNRIVLALEAPFGGLKHTMFGLGKAHGVWEAVWRSHGLSEKRIVKVKPGEWRRAVLGRDRGGELHKAEQIRAKVAYGYDPRTAPDFPQDQAAAICIAEWASIAPRVSRRVPRKAQKANKERGSVP